jgi:GDPmannose 4,6-dehydratase
MKTALITGITGQDGSYLAELLLEKDYKVIGVARRSSVSTDSNTRLSSFIGHENFKFVEGEVSDANSVYSLVAMWKPDEIYNLAAQSHVGTSFEQPDYTFQVNALGPTYFLEAIRRYSPKTRFYQASTSEMFGKNSDKVTSLKNDAFIDLRVQGDKTAFMPQSPYGVAKLAAHHQVRIYREAYGIHASCGILFNHESERRGENFVTRKITKWIGDFVRWKNRASSPIEPASTFSFDEDHIYENDFSSSRLSRFPKLRLGNLDAYRDWGHAQDYVEAMHKMLQQDVPDDYVIATGETNSVRDFLKEAFNEIGITNYQDYIVIDPKFYRPAEVEFLCGDPSKANTRLNWYPKINFRELVKRMVRSDINGEKKKEACKEKTL